MKPRFRVVAALDVRYHAARRMIAGILRFAASHGEWDLQMRGNHPFNDGFTLDPGWHPDGMIVDGSWAKSRSASFRDMVAGRRARHPLQGVVFANCIPPQSCRVPHAMVRTDERAISVAAAELFVHHGFTHFAFVGPRVDSRWSVARRKFFAAALRDAGHESPFVYKSPKTDVLQLGERNRQHVQLAEVTAEAMRHLGCIRPEGEAHPGHLPPF